MQKLEFVGGTLSIAALLPKQFNMVQECAIQIINLQKKNNNYINENNNNNNNNNNNDIIY